MASRGLRQGQVCLFPRVSFISCRVDQPLAVERRLADAAVDPEAVSGGTGLLGLVGLAGWAFLRHESLVGRS